MSENFNIEQQDFCQTRFELLESPKFRQFLRLYNRQMGKKDPTHQPVRLADVTSYNTAKKLYDYWEQIQVSGQVKAITGVQDYIRRLMEEMRYTDSCRTLGQKETEIRLGNIGINLPLIHRKAEAFYKDLGFEEALQKVGILAKGEPYTLPLPELDEAAMQIIERSFALGYADSLFIDDSRLTDREMVAWYFRSLPKNKRDLLLMQMEDTIQLSKKEMNRVRAYTGKYDPELAKKFFKNLYDGHLGDPGRQVKYLAHNSGFGLPANENNRALPCESFTEFLEKTSTPMSLGTFLRLSPFLQKHHPAAWQNTYLTKKEGYCLNQAGTLLNNITPDGQILSVSGDSPRTISLKKANPAVASPEHFIRGGLFLP